MSVPGCLYASECSFIIGFFYVSLGMAFMYFSPPLPPLPPASTRPPLPAAAVGLTTVKKRDPSMHPSVITPCSLPACLYKQLHACQLLPALLSPLPFLLPYSILSPAIQIWFKQGNSSLLGKLCTNVRVKGLWLCGDLAHHPAFCFPMHGPLGHLCHYVPSQNIDI